MFSVLCTLIQNKAPVYNESWKADGLFKRTGSFYESMNHPEPALLIHAKLINVADDTIPPHTLKILSGWQYSPHLSALFTGLSSGRRAMIESISSAATIHNLTSHLVCRALEQLL